ncbi:hypothetical protein HBI89_144170 [Parastagonospora nodorum]|nr:hypothetical protein HBI90_134350 [Parastagonospora nodorum]KAH5901284.1 hypothetical protein HBI89_144170 [Parastagonospora nodorum]KAH6537632.1 hypothetical protein HBI07_130270 [Parastagonospora nodorum]
MGVQKVPDGVDDAALIMSPLCAMNVAATIAIVPRNLITRNAFVCHSKTLRFNGHLPLIRPYPTPPHPPPANMYTRN